MPRVPCSLPRRKRSENPCRTCQRLPDAPGERDSDKQPEKHRPCIQPALADTERAVLDPGLSLGARGLQPGYISLAHMPFRINRFDQVGADQASDQHRTKNVHGAIVELV